MAKRELSSTLKNLKFMQRAVQREEKRNKEEDVKPVGNFSSSDTRKCVVIMEGDPHPGAAIGRMSFGSFNPSVDKLNEEAADLRSPEPSGGNMPLRDNRSSLDGAENSNTAKPKRETNGDLKRKQIETEDQNKSAKVVQDQSVLSPKSTKGSFKQPKREKLDWNVLIPKRQNK